MECMNCNACNHEVHVAICAVLTGRPLFIRIRGREKNSKVWMSVLTWKLNERLRVCAIFFLEWSIRFSCIPWEDLRRARRCIGSREIGPRWWPAAEWRVTGSSKCVGYARHLGNSWRVEGKNCVWALLFGLHKIRSEERSRLRGEKSFCFLIKSKYTHQGFWWYIY